MNEKLLQEKDFSHVELVDLYNLSLQCDDELAQFSGRAKAWQVFKNRVVEEIERRFIARRTEYQNQEQQRKI